MEKTNSSVTYLKYVMSEFMHNLEGRTAYYPRLEKDKLSGAYPFIPLNFEYFMDNLLLAQNLANRMCKEKPKYSGYQHFKFLDVGCGIGTKVALAQAFGMKSSGIEYSTAYVKKAFDLFGERMVENIWQGDAMKYPDYDKFDIIYFYCPFEDETKQRRLERLVYDGAREGAVLIEVLKQSGARQDIDLAVKNGEKHLRWIGRDVYLKFSDDLKIKVKGDKLYGKQYR